jgi:nucleotide-binding universal stress UspA family protein
MDNAAPSGDTRAVVSTVAVGVDGSATAAEAVKMAAELARKFEAKLVLLSAFEDSHGASAVDPRQSIELQWVTNPAARVRETLARAEEDLKHDGLDCSTRSAKGHPGDVLVRLAEECGADVLVVGNKGMQRRVLGSVPNTVTHKAGCSVLVVKTT